MGVYVYSLRKKAIDVEMEDGSSITAVAIAYAYKEAWGWYSGAYNRMVGRVAAAAERAQDYFMDMDNTPTHVVYFDPDDGSYSGLFEVKMGLPSTVWDSSMDNKDRYEKIGEVKKTKRGRRVVYEHVNMVKLELLARIERIEKINDGSIQVFS